ncbi:MAG: hypothetical protein ACF8OB_01450, partial [Phycisphaeraceae bacterium JB051]
QAARWRCESRGTHYRSDCPASLKAFHVHDVWQRGKNEPEEVAVND